MTGAHAQPLPPQVASSKRLSLPPHAFNKKVLFNKTHSTLHCESSANHESRVDQLRKQIYKASFHRAPSPGASSDSFKHQESRGDQLRKQIDPLGHLLEILDLRGPLNRNHADGDSWREPTLKTASLEGHSSMQRGSSVMLLQSEPRHGTLESRKGSVQTRGPPHAADSLRRSISLHYRDDEDHAPPSPTLNKSLPTSATRRSSAQTRAPDRRGSVQSRTPNASPPPSPAPPAPSILRERTLLHEDTERPTSPHLDGADSPANYPGGQPAPPGPRARTPSEERRAVPLPMRGFRQRLTASDESPLTRVTSDPIHPAPSPSSRIRIHWQPPSRFSFMDDFCPQRTTSNPSYTDGSYTNGRGRYWDPRSVGI
ncbi:hypothetical protein T484DRAFT_1953127 [Baffinella frigidus]|nr:hypothetical protein T484DRAFT_1953127 [Cryptophyta sp. CCMP2293]